MPIELVPNNKHGLTLTSPLIAGAGAVGYADAWPPGITTSMFGAIVTPPVSWRPRRGQSPPRLAETPGGFVLATGDHNPGYRRVIEDHALDWRRLGTPIIMALAGSTPDDWDRLAAHLEEEPSVAGIELQLPQVAHRSDAAAWIGAVRRATTLPVLVKLPTQRAVALATTCVSAGADALVVGTGALATGLAPSGALIDGSTAGPAAFPFTLHALRAVVGLSLGLPLIAAGGICRAGDAERCFDAGAVAVQIRSLLWTDPAAAVLLAEELKGDGRPGMLPNS
jgi:dihydroorotate dehydrogenase (NAD+) catalytic subunit